MYWNLKNNKKHPFLLIEVLVALTLIGTFMPSLLKSELLCKREVDKLTFLNELENAFKRQIFNLYYDIHEEYYIKEIAQMGNEPLTLPYKSSDKDKYLEISENQRYKMQVTLERYDKDGTNYQISALIEVLGLPFDIENPQRESQHFWIPKHDSPKGL